VSVLDLPLDTCFFLEQLDATSLAFAEVVCRTWLEESAAGELWKKLVFHRWGWCIVKPVISSWKLLFSQLATYSCAKFCIVGGILPAGSGARAFAVSSGTWHPMLAPNTERNMPAIVRSDTGDLVVAGGLIHGEELHALQSAEIFKDNQWTSLSSLNTARCCCSAALDSRGRIHVVGGGENMYRNSEAWNSVETFTYDGAIEDGAWHPGPAMREARCALGVAYSSSSDHLFAAGGYAGANCYLSSCEWLDLSCSSAGIWTSLPPMSCRRAGCNAAVGPDSRIYVLGGGPDGRSEHKTMEALDPRMKSWHTDLAPLSVGRHYNAAAFGPDGCLYVAGAFRHSGQLDVVERYDLRTNSWEVLPRIGAPLQFSAGAFLF